MRTRLILALVLALALVVTASVVVAQRGPGKCAPGMGPGMRGPGGACVGCPLMGGPGMVQALGLTADQVAAMKQVQADCAAATQADREALQAKMKQMMTLWTADQPNAGEIKALAADIDRDKAAIRDACIDCRLRAHALLTSEQKAKVREMVKNCAAQCGGSCCGMMLGCGMGMGPGVGCGMGPGAGTGCGMGPGAGAGKALGCCPRGGGQGPTGTGCPMAK